MTQRNRTLLEAIRWGLIVCSFAVVVAVNSLSGWNSGSRALIVGVLFVLTAGPAAILTLILHPPKLFRDR